jgi:hypothetical protein
VQQVFSRPGGQQQGVLTSFSREDHEVVMRCVEKRAFFQSRFHPTSLFLNKTTKPILGISANVYLADIIAGFLFL